MKWLILFLLNPCLLGAEAAEPQAQRLAVPLETDVVESVESHPQIIKAKFKKKTQQVKRPKQIQPPPEPVVVSSPRQMKISPAPSLRTTKPQTLLGAQGSWILSANSRYFGTFNDQAEPSSVIQAKLGYQLFSTTQVYLSPSVTRLYELDSDEKEWQFNDLVFGLWQSIWQDSVGQRGVTADLTATAPTSDYSQRQSVRSAMSASLTGQQSLLQNHMTLEIRPTARYYWNEFSTTVTDEGSNGGTPLPRNMLGASAGVIVRPLPIWSLALRGGWFVYEFEEINLRGEATVDRPRNNRREDYEWSMSTQLTPHKSWFVETGYIHSARLDQPWGNNLLLYDDRVSQWFIGAGINL